MQIEAMSGVIAAELDAVVPGAMRRGWRLRGIGRRDLLPLELQRTLTRIEAETAGNSRLTVQFALGYGGREEIVDALRRWAATEVSGLAVEEALAALQPEALTPFLYGGDLPDPDLILRTSGELRLSGFLLWQSVYSEFYFTDVLWPDFREIDFLRALRSYQARRRRFGR
jgi:short-chain Z-isoprenyl diphosphate synthase